MVWNGQQEALFVWDCCMADALQLWFAAEFFISLLTVVVVTAAWKRNNRLLLHC